ncbi:cytochrome P450 2L1 [Armadillidium vulgare]|nr:cytochrome P450 2L1 [Armadillidium vulgare]
MKANEKGLGSEKNFNFTYEELVYTLSDMFSAGSETTSSTFRWTILYLIKYPEIQKKVHDEIDKALPRDRLPSLLDKDQLVYMQAVINEVLRVNPIAMFGLYHAFDKDIEINGNCIPKDAIVLPSILLCHNDPDYWEDPKSFKPERFITSDGKLDINKEGFLPFSLGKQLWVRFEYKANIKSNNYWPYTFEYKSKIKSNNYWPYTLEYKANIKSNNIGLMHLSIRPILRAIIIQKLDHRRRNCIGESLARMELYFFIVGILQTFEFTAPEGAELKMEPDANRPIFLIPTPEGAELKMEPDANRPIFLIPTPEGAELKMEPDANRPIFLIPTPEGAELKMEPDANRPIFLIPTPEGAELKMEPDANRPIFLIPTPEGAELKMEPDANRPIFLIPTPFKIIMKLRK